MNSNLSSPRLRRRQSEMPELAAICRARHIVAALGGRYSVELGIDVDAEPREIERWGLAATLIGNVLSPSTALHTYRALDHAGVRTIEDAGSCERDELIHLLGEGGCVGYDEHMASRLLALAKVVADRYDRRLGTLGARIVDTHELERCLQTLPGWGPVTARVFLRELRGVWPGARVPLAARAALSAGHLQLPTGTNALSHFSSAAHLDFRDLEGALERLAFAHALDTCPGGEECPYAAFDREQLVRF